VAGDGRRRQDRRRQTASRPLSGTVPLRTIGITTTAAGALSIESSTVRGPGAAVGLFLVALGLAAFDAIDRGGVGARHAGIVAVVVGGGLGSWSLAIVALLVLLKLPVDVHLWMILAAGALGTAAGSILVRRGLPRTIARARLRRSSRSRAVGSTMTPGRLHRAGA
jgi:hypothetical protein